MNEREVFLDWHFICWRANNAKDDSTEFSKELYNRVYSHDHTSCIRDLEFKAWQASANREGYKLVPVEMSWEKADELASAEWDKNKTLFKSQCTDLSVVQVEQFRLRWCKNKAHQIMSDYKKVVGAVE